MVYILHKSERLWKVASGLIEVSKEAQNLQINEIKGALILCTRRRKAHV